MIRTTSARLRKCRRSLRRRSMSSRRSLRSMARSTVGEPPVSSISSMTRAEPGPIPAIFGSRPPSAMRSVSGVSSARTAAAARLYPNICGCVGCPPARSRRKLPTTALTSAWCGGGPITEHLARQRADLARKLLSLALIGRAESNCSQAMEARWTRWAFRAPKRTPPAVPYRSDSRCSLAILVSVNDRSGYLHVDVDTSLAGQRSAGFDACLAIGGRGDGLPYPFQGLECDADRANRVVVAGSPDDGPLSPRQPLSDAVVVGTGIHIDLQRPVPPRPREQAPVGVGTTGPSMLERDLARSSAAD